MTNPQYMGDGVYAHVDELGRAVLTTGHHDPQEADNIIVLEPEVARDVVAYLLRAKLVDVVS